MAQIMAHITLIMAKITALIMAQNTPIVAQITAPILAQNTPIMAQNTGADYGTDYGADYADYGADDRHRLQQNATRPKEGHAQNIQWHACMLSNILSRYIQNISTYKNILRSGAGMHMPVQLLALLPPSPDLEMPPPGK